MSDEIQNEGPGKCESDRQALAGRSIVAYGFVDREGGSVASASYLILKRLLERGHAIEFHAIDGFIKPAGLIGRPGFTYVPTAIAPIRAGWRIVETAVPRRLLKGVTFGYAQLSNAAHERKIAREIRRRHAANPFDVLLVLGMLPPFRVAGLPCVSWPQGAPNGEWNALQSLRDIVVRHGGAAIYRALGALYAYKQSCARRAIRRADILICGSRWSVENWVSLGVPRADCHALPYPVALDHFRPDRRDSRDPSVTTFLWLGRIVPRKRLDLLLDAYQRLRRDRQDIRLKIIGRFEYVGQMRALLDHFGPEDGVEYREFVARDDVPALLRSVDVLVQPSENEDIGSSVLEALACGTLPIVGPTNGTLDYLSPSSIVFDAYTPESLKSAMTHAIAILQAKRAEIATEVRAQAERTFSIDAVVTGVEATLDRVSRPPATPNRYATLSHSAECE
jgi:glycosyltransferase involved in cell wall biosynthesis